MIQHPHFSFQPTKTDHGIAILIDPDKHEGDAFFDFLHFVKQVNPDYVFVGGSLIHRSSVEECTRKIKAVVSCPVVLFPGHFSQLNNEVDAVLLLSLISGRNADALIGQHVLAAPHLHALKAQIVSTGYMLIDGGRPTSVSYMSNSNPIPSDKDDIALCTALAGQYLGMSMIYMDAGSGAEHPIPERMIQKVSDGIDLPLIVGGGLRSISAIKRAWNAGANLVVIGNGLEEDKSFFEQLRNLQRLPSS